MRGNRQTSRHDNEGCCQKCFHLIPEMFSSYPGYAPIPARKYSSPVPERFRPTKINSATIGKIPDSISLIDKETALRSANIPSMRYNIAAMLANRSTSKTEPSTLKTHIVDGSIEYSRTFHANPPFHGRFSFHVRTFHAEDPYRGRFNRIQPNLPRQYPFSWKVQFPGANPPR